MDKIRILILILLLFTINYTIHANESYSSVIRDKSGSSFLFSFNSGEGSIKDKIAKYAISNAQKAQIYFGIMIAGTVVASIGTLLFIPGAVLMGVSYNNTPDNAPWALPFESTNYALWASGVALLASGLSVFFIGITGIIIGLVLYLHFGGSLVFNTEYDINTKKTGISLSYKF